MFIHYGFALAAAAACAVTTYAVAPRARNRRDRNALFRDAASAESMPPAQPSGFINIETTRESEITHAAARLNAPAAAGGKRAFDVVLSLFLLIFLAPLLLLTAIAIRLDSKGPVLYRQCRVGLRGKKFDVIKFRSMIDDAEANGAQYTAPRDKRITRVGRIIRRFRIDEIPQAFNVLRGEMSFVGPRPERPEFICELEREIPLYQCRHLVRPGITGWAQVRYKYTASVEGARNKLRYDLYYIRHFSPALELLIVFMTLRVALFGLGGR